MHSHKQGRGIGEFVASLDAFKIRRTPAGWQIKALTPWASSLLCDPRVLGIVVANDGWPLKGSGNGFIDPGAEPFAAGVGFELRREAMGFLRDLEHESAGWWR